jgi:hypothetical protein
MRRSATSFVLALAISSGTSSLYVTSAKAACLTIDEYSNSIADFWVNHCPFTVRVRWSDEGNCQGWSCEDVVNAGSRESINKLRGRFNWKECRGGACTPSCADAHNC